MSARYQRPSHSLSFQPLLSSNRTLLQVCRAAKAAVWYALKGWKGGSFCAKCARVSLVCTHFQGIQLLEAAGRERE